MPKARDEALRYYFYFIQERMSIFWHRQQGDVPPYTDDTIFQEHKFTNVYRVLDRVSQYLVKHVIYDKEFSQEPQDILLRIIIFKIFNSIPTREFLIDHFGDITVATFDPNKMSILLSKRIAEQTIFSAAYIMTGSHGRYANYKSKHEKRLHMVKNELISEGKLQSIISAQSLKEVFDIFNSCSMIGPFLAYQYAIDCNYSDVINFDENSFVMAGIGAKRGIKKCFEDTRGYSDEDCIRRIHTHFAELQRKYGYTDFKPLGDRPPTLIDLQNCFCETDKYLRAKLPQLNLGNTRIKQKFHQHTDRINYFLPPKRKVKI